MLITPRTVHLPFTVFSCLPMYHSSVSPAARTAPAPSLGIQSALAVPLPLVEDVGCVLSRVEHPVLPVRPCLPAFSHIHSLPVQGPEWRALFLQGHGRAHPSSHGPEEAGAEEPAPSCPAGRNRHPSFHPSVQCKHLHKPPSHLASRVLLNGFHPKPINFRRSQKPGQS